jgi:hypothetical protein
MLHIQMPPRPVGRSVAWSAGAPDSSAASACTSCLPLGSRLRGQIRADMDLAGFTRAARLKAANPAPGRA